MSREEIIEFLNKLNIETKIINHDEIGFSRTISFNVGNLSYYIIWYKNESKLKIGDNADAPFIPFKYMYYDTTYPIRFNCIGFSYVKKEKRSLFGSVYPYEVFRIPIPK